MITCEDECITKKRDEKQEAETCLDLAKMSDNGKQLWLKNGTIRFLSVIIRFFDFCEKFVKTITVLFFENIKLF